MRRLALAVVGAGALLAAAPAGAPAYPPITCGRVAVSGHGYIVRTHGPSCGFAKHWVKVFIKYHHGPRGYKCRAYGSTVPAYCRGTHRRYLLANPVPSS